MRSRTLLTTPPGEEPVPASARNDEEAWSPVVALPREPRLPSRATRLVVALAVLALIATGATGAALSYLRAEHQDPALTDVPHRPTP